MLSKKGTLLVAVLFAAAVFLTGQARSILDGITTAFRNDFREMMYMPRGNALKVIACGFDAPLADALFIKAMVYYGESIQDERTIAAGTGYTYELFDVITDLSPRFHRAYEIGSIFLTSSSSLESNLKGKDLLLKGVETFDNIAKTGEKVRVDPRWLFHVLLANIYDVNIQPKLRRMGDGDGAANARIEAAKHFREGATSPNAPEYILLAASGYERLNRGKGDIVEANIAIVSVWLDLYEQAKARGDNDLAAELDQRIRTMEEFVQGIVDTRGLQQLLSDAGKRYLAERKHLPRGVADLVQAGLLREKPARYPLEVVEDELEDKDGEAVKDFFWVLPDGSFRSNLLANLEISAQADFLLNAVILYRRANRIPPPELQDLVKGNYLDALPIPPLAALGQKFEYNPKSGMVRILNPAGPELPPNLQ